MTSLYNSIFDIAPNTHPCGHVCTQLLQVLATAKRLQKKYEKKEERRKNGRKCTIQSGESIDCSVGALRRDLRARNEKRVEKARKKEQVLADKKRRIGKKSSCAEAGT